MLEQFDRMEAAGDLNNNEYIDVDMLKILYEYTNSESENVGSKENRQKIVDYKPNLLHSLIYENEANSINQDYKLNREELKVVRRYTINFNPAIEIEFDPNWAKRSSTQPKEKTGN